ncbi:MAG: hypothetical protein HY474_02085 [Candidatus Sungbacteria bacterium]|uniref:Uncharacterized protein n=1 Tax=Candidatus Sungiibacteriota bacterium TaxID=2750080 RepID=A0A932YY89_9BACT|nr:hypothetical protein [Candidatus Sungbacteria bacterium]
MSEEQFLRYVEMLAELAWLFQEAEEEILNAISAPPSPLPGLFLFL